MADQNDLPLYRICRGKLFSPLDNPPEVPYLF